MAQKKFSQFVTEGEERPITSEQIADAIIDWPSLPGTGIPWKQDVRPAAHENDMIMKTPNGDKVINFELRYDEARKELIAAIERMTDKERRELADECRSFHYNFGRK